MSRVRFGPAGIPIQCKTASTLDGVVCCHELQLDAMEIEFVRGVRIKEEQANEIKKTAERLDVALSSHAPYFINLCSTDEYKVLNSKRNIFEAARATFWCGGTITVFHPGYYQGLTTSEAYQNAKKNLNELHEKISKSKINGVILGAETVGKKSQFGGFFEVIKLAQELQFVKPVLDFAHMHARGDFNIRNEDDYRKIFAIIEKELPDYVKNLHIHFSEINYGEKGERNHLPLCSNNTPPFKPLLKVLKENGYSGTIISESPKLEFDAIIMRDEYARIKSSQK
jgi:deoxyribonuclease-4